MHVIVLLYACSSFCVFSDLVCLVFSVSSVLCSSV